MADDTILVLGHSGTLGQAILRAGPGQCEVIEGGRRSFDLAAAGLKAKTCAMPGPGESKLSADQAEAVLCWVRGELAGDAVRGQGLHAGLDLVRAAILEAKSQLVINCAGYTDVDGAQAHPEAAMAVNAAGVEAVAQACAAAGKHLLHVSTDYVFDGAKGAPYREDDPPAPLSVYGRSKLEGEIRARKALPGVLIVRSAWLFGSGRPSFVDKVIGRVRSGKEARVVTDQVGSPTYAADLAEALIWLSRRRVGGLLHVVNSGRASRYELARQAVRLAGLDQDMVKPVASAEYKRPAPRPANSVLETRRFARLHGGALPPWLDALGRYLGPGRERQV